MKKRKPWSFCYTPEEKCTMNYCDDNGCMNRPRINISASPPLMIELLGQNDDTEVSVKAAYEFGPDNSLLFKEDHQHAMFLHVAINDIHQSLYESCYKMISDHFEDLTKTFDPPLKGWEVTRMEHRAFENSKRLKLFFIRGEYVGFYSIYTKFMNDEFLKVHADAHVEFSTEIPVPINEKWNKLITDMRDEYQALKLKFKN